MLNLTRVSVFFLFVYFPLIFFPSFFTSLKTKKIFQSQDRCWKYNENRYKNTNMNLNMHTRTNPSAILFFIIFYSLRYDKYTLCLLNQVERVREKERKSVARKHEKTNKIFLCQWHLLHFIRTTTRNIKIFLKWQHEERDDSGKMAKIANWLDCCMQINL